MTSARGLRRFVDRPDSPVAFAQRQRPSVGEQCEMCAEPIGPDHRHVVNLDSRRLLCTCTPCALLFAQHGAGGGTYRAVPDTYLASRIDEAAWDELRIPVGMAFLFVNSRLGRVVAQYPSPAGATESLLDLAAWDTVASRSPGVTSMEPDVEAFLVRRSRDGRFEAYVVPIDVCYELVGALRLHWTGFDGGPAAERDIESFFTRIRGRTRPVPGLGERSDA